MMELYLRSQQQPISCDWTSLCSDLTEQILNPLPIRSLIRASTVCKHWQSTITTNSFTSRFSSSKKPWFFLFGQNNIFLKNNQSFAFDPESNEWISLPSCPPSLFSVSSGFCFASIAQNKISYAPILNCTWRETSPLRFARLNPLVGVFIDGSGFSRFIVVGGVRFIGGLVDIEDGLPVEIYNPQFDHWDRCPPLPADFRSGYSSHLSSAMFKDRFYVLEIYSCFVSWFDLDKHVWSDVHTLRPPGVVLSFLFSCRARLVLAGLCNGSHGLSFHLWSVDENTMEFTEIAIMPRDLLYGMFDNDEDEKFASLKCVGLDNLIYVFNEEYHRNYPACVCEIRNDDSGKCSWRRVPHLPSPVNQFHKVLSFCSTVPLDIVI